MDLAGSRAQLLPSMNLITYYSFINRGDFRDESTGTWKTVGEKILMVQFAAIRTNMTYISRRHALHRMELE